MGFVAGGGGVAFAGSPRRHLSLKIGHLVVANLVVLYYN